MVESMGRSDPPSRWLGEQVVALSLMITAMKYGVLSEGSDEEFLAGAVGACDELYRHRQSDKSG